MEPFKTSSPRIAVPLTAANVDTDQIIPKQFLKRIERTGYGEFLFFDWRRSDARRASPIPTSCSTSRATRARRFSIAGKNFGCGSSPRARRLGTQRVRLPRRHRADLCRHLLLERRQERNRPRPPQRRAR